MFWFKRRITRNYLINENSNDINNDIYKENIEYINKDDNAFIKNYIFEIYDNIYNITK